MERVLGCTAMLKHPLTRVRTSGGLSVGTRANIWRIKTVVDLLVSTFLEGCMVPYLQGVVTYPRVFFVAFAQI